jgi:hypothetical protein
MTLSGRMVSYLSHVEKVFAQGQICKHADIWICRRADECLSAYDRHTERHKEWTFLPSAANIRRFSTGLTAAAWGGKAKGEDRWRGFVRAHAPVKPLRVGRPVPTRGVGTAVRAHAWCGPRALCGHTLPAGVLGQCELCRRWCPSCIVWQICTFQSILMPPFPNIPMLCLCGHALPRRGFVWAHAAARARCRLAAWTEGVASWQPCESYATQRGSRPSRV